MQKFNLNHLSKLPLVLTALGLLSVMTFFFTQSCKEIEEINGNSIGSIKSAYSPLGVTNVGGVLHFVDRATLEEVYDSLLNNQGTGYNPAIHDTICVGGTHPYLDSFEMNLNFTSIRRQYEVINCSELDAGLEPINLSESHIFDDVMATLISPDFRVWIADTLFYWQAENLIYYSNALDAEERMDAVENGASGTAAGVVNYLNNKYKKAPCNPEFEIDLNFAGNKATITYTGGGNPTTIDWTVDGVLGHQQSTQFDLTNLVAGQTYTVCCTVKDDNGTPNDKSDDCEMKKCQDFTMGSCVALFTFTDPDENGNVCFQDLSKTNAAGGITSWTWQIDGQTFSQQNPCYTFTTNCTYNVVLTVKSAACPNGVSIPRKVRVESFECCGFKGKKKGSEAYNGTNNEWRWKWHLGSDVIWDQRLKTKLGSYVKKPNGKWKYQAISKMEIDFDEHIFKPDQNCACRLPENIAPTPAGQQGMEKEIVVVDKLGGIKFNSRQEQWNRIKIEDPVWIHYKCDIWTIKDVNTADNGLECPQ